MLIFALGIILGALIYYKLYKPTTYWQGRNVVNVQGAWPLFGNMVDLVLKRKHQSEILTDIYEKYPNERYVGFLYFTSPSLLLKDLELIKQIGIKQFAHFPNHTIFSVIDNEPLLGKTLIHLRGDKWKQMRATLSPVFTSSKMRSMYNLMVECAENFVKHFEKEQQVDVEMKNVCSRFANDVIASTAFGIQVNSLKDPKNDFYTMGKALTEFSTLQLIKILMSQASKFFTRLLRIRFFPPKVLSFFRSIITDNIRKRREENIVRPDLIHLLLDAQKGQLKYDDAEGANAGFSTVEESHIGKSLTQMELTDEHIEAQALLFFFAGFETISTAASFMAHELAIHPEIQKKIQEEIDEVNEKCEGKITYELLLSMKYLDQVISESLRLWPPAFQTDRQCSQDFLINAEKNNETPLLVEQNLIVIVPIMAIHHDPKYFPIPELFDPDRFSEENKANIVPGSYLPFGIGPRNCIGSRFALLEAKILFFYLLLRFDIIPNEKTEIPLKVSPAKGNMAPANGFNLSFRNRKKAN